MSLYKIGIWFLLPAFIAVSIILPLAAPPAIFAESLILPGGIGIVSILSLPVPQYICSHYHTGIRPRSPPVI
jgi:hypothetical protein